MQGHFITILLLLVSVALQGAWPVWLRIGGQPPNLLVAVVTCTGLLRGAADGCLAGLIAAVLLGASARIPLGGLFVGFMLVGAAAGFLRGSLFAERLQVAILMAALGVVGWEFVRMVFVPPPEFVIWLGGTISSALFTALAVPVVFWATKFARPKEPDI